MIANQVKSIALTSLLVVGTVATGVVVGATQLSGGSADTDKSNQAPAISTDLASVKVSGPVVQAAVRQAGGATPSVSPQLAQQLSTTRTLFGQLLSSFREPEIEDIDRLSRWSLITLEADQVLATTESDRVAAYEAHRDRMKRLHEFTQKIPVSDKNQPVKADHAQNILQQAEEWLENTRQGQTPGPGVRMSRMRGMMGGGGGQMAEMMQTMMGGRGQMGIMGAGRMGEMGSMAKGSFSVPAKDESRASELPANETSKEKSDSASPEQGAAAKNATDKGAPQKGAARIGGKDRASNITAGSGGGMGGGTGVMGGGMGGMGGGMGGMGPGMGGMGPGMGGMGGGFMAQTPEQLNRQTRVRIAGYAAEMAVRDTNAQSKAVLKKLDESISMSFASATPLEDVLKYIRQATVSPSSATGVPIYVDPKGLKEAEATLQSPIRLDLEGVPLKTTLRLMLKQIGLAYCVRDGVLIISSIQGINEELEEANSELEATNSKREGSGGFMGGFGGNLGGGMR
jgi:hypothetical protein